MKNKAGSTKISSKPSSKLDLLKKTNQKTQVRKRSGFWNFKEAVPAFKLCGCFMIMIAFLVLRNYILMNRISDSVYLLKSLTSFLHLYWCMQASQMVMSEMALWDEKSTVNYIKPSEFFHFVKKELDEIVFPEIDRLASQNSPATSVKIMHDVLNKEPFCDVLQGTAENGHLYKNCESAISGLAIMKVHDFLKGYVNLIDQFIDTWKVEPTLEARRALIHQDRYASLQTYAVYNQFGTMDAVYYHLLIPMTTELNLQLKRILPSVNLLNIVAVSVCAIYAAFVIPFLYFWAIDMLRRFEELLTSIPVNLIEHNPHILALLKRVNTAKYPLLHWL